MLFLCQIYFKFYLEKRKIHVYSGNTLIVIKKLQYLIFHHSMKINFTMWACHLLNFLKNTM